MRIPIDKKIEFTLLTSGILGTILSIVYESTVLAFIGLTLAFWGCLFLLLVPGEYVESKMMDSLCSSSLSAIDQVISDSNCQGEAVYIPVPREAYLPYLTRIKTEFIYIPKRNVKIEKAMEQAFMKNPRGLRLTPPGLGLANLMEGRCKAGFHNLDIDMLTDVLPSIAVRELEMADEFKLRLEGNRIRTVAKNPFCKDLCKEASKMHHICPNVGCPLSSSIACILTRAALKPVAIERCSLDNNNIETWYHLL